MSLAPIVIFAYNRPWHLSQMFESLKGNAEAVDSEITVFCDGSKPNATREDIQKIEEARSVARAQTWCKKLTVVEAEQNKGLANSVIAGVTSVVERHGRIIVIEDDVILSPFFLAFMNDALEVYEKEEKVLSIGSWNYFHSPPSPKEHFFLTMPDTIAWATWSRAWKLFEPDSSYLMNQLKRRSLMKKFNLDGQYDFQRMLQAQADGKISSWAIRWTAIAVLKDTLSLYPSKALSKHAGFGTDATNCFGLDFNSNLELANEKLDVNFYIPTYSKDAEKNWLHIERDIIGSDAVTYPLFSRRTIQRWKRWVTSKLS